MDCLSTPGDTSWFVKDRFGLFIHWGLFSMPARHDWVMSHEKMTIDAYRKYFEHFEPDLYDPNIWASAAAGAGMKYFVITTKHHEGFCLWDTAYTDYKATNTRAGRDLIKPMVDAFREQGLRTGFYYSLLDWHHPHYVVDRCSHPQREVSDEELERLNAGRDQSVYAQYMRNQVRELLTSYGDVDVLWFDFSFMHKVKEENKARDDFVHNKGREAWESEKLYALVRELAPKAILTDRLDLDMPLSGGDIKTPEQVQPRQWVTIEHEGRQVPVVWETCQTFSGSWIYNRDEHTWRSTRQLLSTLIDTVSKGGNLLLNVGPTGRGEFDHRALSRLEGIGQWMRRHGRSIYGCTQAPEAFNCPRDCRLTYNPDTRRLYVHLLDWPYGLIYLDGQAYRDRVEYAQLLHDGSELTGPNEWDEHQLKLSERGIKALRLPAMEPAGVEIPVIELFLKD